MLRCVYLNLTFKDERRYLRAICYKNKLGFKYETSLHMKIQNLSMRTLMIAKSNLKQLVRGYYYCFRKILSFPLKSFLGCLRDLHYDMLAFFVKNKKSFFRYEGGMIDWDKFMEKVEIFCPEFDSTKGSNKNFYVHLINYLKKEKKINSSDIRLFVLCVVMNYPNNLSGVMESICRCSGFVSVIRELKFKFWLTFR